MHYCCVILRTCTISAYNAYMIEYVVCRVCIAMYVLYDMFVAVGGYVFVVIVVVVFVKPITMIERAWFWFNVHNCTQRQWVV